VRQRLRVSCTMISTGSAYVSMGTYENLSPGDVNPGPIPSRRGLLEDSPYHVIWVACLSCDWL
jgi:hypothetical protein